MVPAFAAGIRSGEVAALIGGERTDNEPHKEKSRHYATNHPHHLTNTRAARTVPHIRDLSELKHGRVETLKRCNTEGLWRCRRHTGASFAEPAKLNLSTPKASESREDCGINNGLELNCEFFGAQLQQSIQYDFETRHRT